MERTIFATWPIGTATPPRVPIVRSAMRSSAARSLATARATTSIRSSPARIVVTVAPPISVCKLCAIS